jgi:outer membrane protein assembly factor BamB
MSAARLLPVPLPEALRAALRVALLVAPLVAGPPVAVAAPAAVDWPMVRRDPGGRAAVRITTRQPGERVEGWQFQASSHVWSYQPGMAVWSSAALGLVDGRAVVVVGSYDNNVYCLDAVSGEKRWRFTTGGGVYSAPALWRGDGDGPALVLAASSDRLVYALDADLGRRVWVHAVKTWRPTMGGARLSAPAVGRAGGAAAVFFGHWVWDKSISGHMQAGGLTALGARSGKPLWTTPLGDNQISSPIYAELEGKGRVFVGAETGNLYALDADSGRVLWSYVDRDAIKGNPAYFTSPTGPRVVFGSKYGRLRCLDARSGQEVWRFETGHWLDGSPAVARVGMRELVFVGSYDTRLYAVDASNGAGVWSHRTAGGIYSSPAVVGEGGGRAQVLFSSWDHHLYSVAAGDGSLNWSAFLGRPIWDSITLGDSIWASPSVAVINGQAVAYVGSYAGPFYAVVLDEARRKALARPGSNLQFWVLLPLVMLATTGLALFLTRRHRREKRLRM